MKLNMQAIKKVAIKTGLKLKKYSPEILLFLGISGGIAGTVVACKETPKAVEAHDQFLEEVEALHENEERTAKDTIRVYTRAGVRYIKIYGPAVGILAAGIGCHVGSYAILHNRGVALATALASTTAAFEEYRRNVVDKYGAEAEKEIRFGLREATVEDCVDAEDVADIEAGKKKMTMSTTGFDRCFDEYNPMWTKSAVDNLNFLVQCQAYANEKLRSNGHLFVNELMDILHYPRVKAGQIDGWIYDPSRDDLHNFIDLGLFSVKDTPHDSFLRGMETSVWLTINPDGDILSLMK